MLVKLEDEEVYKRIAKYFPQQTNPGQPEINNERWKVLMNYCQENYRVMEMPVKDIIFQFNWPYLPMTYGDIVGYFTHFY